MAATVKDIARKAGLSVSTVSRVLNKKAKQYRISEEAEAQVLRIAHELNYRANHIARGLRLKRTLTIGLVVPDISNPFFSHITRIAQNVASQSGYSLIVCDTNENLEIEIEQIDLLLSKGVDGFLIMPVGIHYEHIEQLIKDGKPLVLVDRSFDVLDINSVVVDNYNGAYKAVEHCIEQKHQRIAIIQGLQSTSTNNLRVQGYLDALEHYNVPIDRNLIVGRDFRQENGYIETKLLLNLEQPPTAIFTTSDLITLGALQAIYEEKKKIPQDVSLVAFDDIDFAPYLISPLTTVNQPKELMGEIAVKLLIDDIQSDESREKQRIVLKPKLIIRKSVAPPKIR